MNIYNFFNIPNWNEYKQNILNFYDHVHNYDYNSVDTERKDNFLKILKREKLSVIAPGLIRYFDNLGKHIVFLETVGIPYTEDPYSEIHKDASPLFEDYFMADYAINFSLRNTENSKIVFFNEEQKEINRLNYDICPLLFRSNVWHSVVNHDPSLRLTASIRFSVNTSMEEFL